MLSREINGHHVEFGMVRAPHFSSFDSTDKKYRLPSLRSQKGSVSLLAKLYYAFHNQLRGRKDLLTPKYARIRQCTVVDELLKQADATPKELAAICSLFGNRSDIFASVLSSLGRSDLLFLVDRKKFRAELKQRQPKACREALAISFEFEGKFPCTGGCGVSSPAALPFLPWGVLLERPIGPSCGGCALTEQGLYLSNETNDDTTKVMEPIWVSQSLQGVGRELGAREVVCHDAHGLQKTLSIGEEDLDSPRLFAILRSHGVHVPISKTEQGKIREYLVSQFPAAAPTHTATSTSGWQQDGRHIDPNGDTSTFGSHYPAKSVAVPRGDFVKPGSIRASKATADSLVLLAILASLSGAVLKPLQRSGVCIHFHGSSEEARMAILHSASSIWDERVYSFDEAKKHVRDLKRKYADSTLCVGGVTEEKVRSMRSFVKRFFLGRKGADDGIQGVVVSTGDKPLAQSQNRQRGVNAFTVNGEVLAIDVPIAQSSGVACSVKGLASSLVNALYLNLADTRGCLHDDLFRFANQHQKSQKGKLQKQVANFYWLFAAVGCWIYGEKKLSWWQGNSLNGVFEGFVEAADKQEADFLRYLTMIAQRIPCKFRTDTVEMELPSPLVDIGHGCILVSSEWMKTLIDNRSTLRGFLEWLRVNRILVRKAGKNCANYHHPKKQKSVRGYALRTTAIRSMISRSS